MGESNITWQASDVLRVTSVNERRGDPVILDVDSYVPFRFRTDDRPLGCATLCMGAPKKTLLEIAIEPGGQVVRGLTIVSLGELVSWPKFSVRNSTPGLPAISTSFEGGEVMHVEDEFRVSCRGDEMIVFWGPLNACTAHAYGALRFLVCDETLVGVLCTALSPKQTHLIRYHSFAARDTATKSGSQAAHRGQGPFVRYLFIWDKQKSEVAASFYFHCRDRPDHIARDVSRGAIPDEDAAERTRSLETEFPIERYLYAGGYAPSLEACVRGFFAMEKDDPASS